LENDKGIVPKMHVLLTNDDGIYAKGLWALIDSFAADHRVTVVAPDRERSAVGHGITLHQPLRVHRITINGALSGYAVTGTPADCIKLAILEIMDSRPDLVISGINPGNNVGDDINYSGTVAAAKEAALYGIPAMAVSVQRSDEPCNYNAAAVFIKDLADTITQKGLPFGTFLNVNLPIYSHGKIPGIRISRQGSKQYSEYFDKRTDPRNRTYFWHGSNSCLCENESDMDGNVLGKNYISITPIKCDMTDYNSIANLKKWEIKIRKNGSS